MSNDRLAEIEARAAGATEGPWDYDGLDDQGAYYVHEDRSVVTEHAIEEDADFIAHARTDVPALVAALRAVLDIEPWPSRPAIMQGYELDEAQGYNECRTEVRRAIIAALAVTS